MSPALSDGAVFPLLAEPARYRPCDLDLLADDAARAYWVGLFERQFEAQLEAARSIGVAAAGVARAREALRAALDLIRHRPGDFDRLDLIALDGFRTEALTAGGIADEYRLVKAAENDRALAALPARLEAIDAIEGPARFAAIVHGMLAGNLFDMGAETTGGRYRGGSLDFAEALDMVPPRPWYVDDVEVAGRGLATASPGRIVVFVDNAGPDAVLGVMPLARELVRGGGHVVLAANAAPALNDVTVDEMRGLLDRASAVDAVFADPRLELVSSGSGSPLIDLRRVSGGLADAARDAGFVVLVGMGRAIESNWSARFTCPTLRIAMLKDPHVAADLGGALFDAVCRFEA